MRNASRTILSVADVAGIPIFIGWYIWRGQFSAPRAFLWAIAWIVASFLIHRDTPKTLGMRGDNLWPATQQTLAIYGAFAVGLFMIGLVLHQPVHPPPNYRSFGRLENYFAFCLVQQVALNSLLTNRLLSLLQRHWLVYLVAGVIFSGLHWPNPVLVPLTLIAGIAMSWMFARERNVIPLAIGQALLGSLVWWAFPIAWHHMLRVGPGYYSPY